jgi:sulfur carrier protein
MVATLTPRQVADMIPATKAGPSKADEGCMRVQVNGEWREFPDGASVAELIRALGMEGTRVAAELNLKIVRRADHGQTIVMEGDRLELVTMVGGG